jgi:hypothetical protein
MKKWTVGMSICRRRQSGEAIQTVISRHFAVLMSSLLSRGTDAML